MADRMAQALDRQPPGELSNRALWRWRVARTPDRRWLWFEDREWTYAQFDVEVRRLAAGLRRFGVEPGTRVLVGMSNRPEAVQTHLALAQLGAVIVPLVPGMPFEELAYPMRHSEATVLVADDPIAGVLAERREDWGWIDRVVVLGDAPAIPGAHAFEELAAAEPLPAEAHDDDDLQALALVVYTSGSTGRPKGVMLKAGSQFHCGLGYADLYAFTDEDAFLLPMTLAHGLGAIAGLGIPMVTGGTLVLAERFRPTRFWDVVARSGATISVLFQAHLALLLETDDGSIAPASTSLRFVVTHAYLPEFVERFGVELGTIWGMSETLGCVGSDPGYRGELGPGYVGHAFVGGEVQVLDETLRPCPAYAFGEIVYRHPQAMLGYLKDEETTRATLVDGWVRSGDRGFLDHTGRLYFAGRFKAMIKRSGENVSAEEVEQALAGDPAVAECVVVGVPDRLRSEEVGAVVVLRAGARTEASALRDACGERLVRWKLPRYIVVREEPLPRLASGKIDRVRAAELLDLDAAWDAESGAAAR